MRERSLSRYRVSHMHGCGHVDDCFLSREDAENSDCRQCRADKANAQFALDAAARRAKEQPKPHHHHPKLDLALCW